MGVKRPVLNKNARLILFRLAIYIILNILVIKVYILHRQGLGEILYFKMTYDTGFVKDNKCTKTKG